MFQGIYRAAAAAIVAIMLHTLVLSPAEAQFFNVDVDLPGAPPANGGGVPSSGFGAAANQIGVWNSFSTSGPSALLDLAGSPTSVTLAITASSTSNSVLAFNNPANTGDFASLLNDGAQIGTTLQGGSRTYTFSGIADGPYSVWTYTARPQGTDGELLVNVVGSNEGQLVSAGIPVGNTFTAGVSHVVHTLNVVGGTIEIQLTDIAGAPAGYVDGFQVAAIPEPVIGLLPVAALLGMGIRRRRPRPIKPA